MMWWHDGGGGSATTAVATVAFWGFLGGALLGVLRGLLHHPDARAGDPQAHPVTDERPARGELEEEQHLRTRDLMCGGPR